MTKKTVDASAWMKQQPHRKVIAEKRIFGTPLESGIDPMVKQRKSKRGKKPRKGLKPSLEFREKAREALKAKKEELGVLSMKEAAGTMGIPAKQFERLVYYKTTCLQEEHLKAFSEGLGLELELDDEN